MDINLNSHHSTIVKGSSSNNSSSVYTDESDAWNIRFQTAIAMPEVTQEERREKYNMLNSVNKDFIAIATVYAKTIISEYFLPDAKKSIKIKEVGGLAGGKKFLWRDILFKLVDGTQGPYERDHEAASKAMGHEMKSVNAYFRCTMADIHVALQALIDYKGFRMLAQAFLPIDGKNTLIIGSADGMQSVHNSYGALSTAQGELVRSSEESLKFAAMELNLSEHRVGKATMYSACDVEGHIGSDGRFYIIDLARTFPPESPSKAPHLIQRSGFHLGQVVIVAIPADEAAPGVEDEFLEPNLASNPTRDSSFSSSSPVPTSIGLHPRSSSADSLALSVNSVSSASTGGGVTAGLGAGVCMGTSAGGISRSGSSRKLRLNKTPSSPCFNPAASGAGKKPPRFRKYRGFVCRLWADGRYDVFCPSATATTAATSNGAAAGPTGGSSSFGSVRSTPSPSHHGSGLSKKTCGSGSSTRSASLTPPPPAVTSNHSHSHSRNSSSISGSKVRQTQQQQQQQALLERLQRHSAGTEELSQVELADVFAAFMQTTTSAEEQSGSNNGHSQTSDGNFSGGKVLHSVLEEWLLPAGQTIFWRLLRPEFVKHRGVSMISAYKKRQEMRSQQQQQQLARAQEREKERGRRSPTLVGADSIGADGVGTQQGSLSPEITRELDADRWAEVRDDCYEQHYLSYHLILREDLDRLLESESQEEEQEEKEQVEVSMVDTSNSRSGAAGGDDGRRRSHRRQQERRNMNRFSGVFLDPEGTGDAEEAAAAETVPGGYTGGGMAAAFGITGYGAAQLDTDTDSESDNGGDHTGSAGGGAGGGTVDDAAGGGDWALGYNSDDNADNAEGDDDDSGGIKKQMPGDGDGDGGGEYADGQPAAVSALPPTATMTAAQVLVRGLGDHANSNSISINNSNDKKNSIARPAVPLMTNGYTSAAALDFKNIYSSAMSVYQYANAELLAEDMFDELQALRGEDQRGRLGDQQLMRERLKLKNKRERQELSARMQREREENAAERALLLLSPEQTHMQVASLTTAGAGASAGVASNNSLSRSCSSELAGLSLQIEATAALDDEDEDEASALLNSPSPDLQQLAPLMRRDASACSGISAISSASVSAPASVGSGGALYRHKKASVRKQKELTIINPDDLTEQESDKDRGTAVISRDASSSSSSIGGTAVNFQTVDYYGLETGGDFRTHSDNGNSLQRAPTALSSDALSGFSRDKIKDKDVHDATETLICNLVPAVADDLMSNGHPLHREGLGLSLIEYIHHNGINIRHVGLLRGHIDPWSPIVTEKAQTAEAARDCIEVQLKIRRELLRQCVVRTLKHTLQDLQRRYMRRKQNSSSELFMHVLVTQFLNLVTGAHVYSIFFWRNIVTPGLYRRFGEITLAKDERDDDNDAGEGENGEGECFGLGLGRHDADVLTESLAEELRSSSSSSAAESNRPTDTTEAESGGSTISDDLDFILNCFLDDMTTNNNSNNSSSSGFAGINVDVNMRTGCCLPAKSLRKMKSHSRLMELCCIIDADTLRALIKGLCKCTGIQVSQECKETFSKAELLFGFEFAISDIRDLCPVVKHMHQVDLALGIGLSLEAERHSALITEDRLRTSQDQSKVAGRGAAALAVYERYKVVKNCYIEYINCVHSLRLNRAAENGALEGDFIGMAEHMRKSNSLAICIRLADLATKVLRSALKAIPDDLKTKMALADTYQTIAHAIANHYSIEHGGTAGGTASMSLLRTMSSAGDSAGINSGSQPHSPLPAESVALLNDPMYRRIDECFRQYRNLCEHTRCCDLGLSYKEDILGIVVVVVHHWEDRATENRKSEELARAKGLKGGIVVGTGAGVGAGGGNGLTGGGGGATGKLQGQRGMGLPPASSPPPVSAGSRKHGGGVAPGAVHIPAPVPGVAPSALPTAPRTAPHIIYRAQKSIKDVYIHKMGVSLCAFIKHVKSEYTDRGRRCNLRFLPLIIDEQHASRGRRLLFEEMVRIDCLNDNMYESPISPNQKLVQRPGDVKIREYGATDTTASGGGGGIAVDVSTARTAATALTSTSAVSSRSKPSTLIHRLNQTKICLPEFSAEIGFRVMSALMNRVVMNYCLDQQFSIDGIRRSDNSGIGGKSFNPDDYFTGYARLHHMLLYMSALDDDWKRIANEKIFDFLYKPETRVKKLTPDIGRLLIYLLLSKYEWDEAFAEAYLEEALSRQVSWFLTPPHDTANKGSKKKGKEKDRENKEKEKARKMAVAEEEEEAAGWRLSARKGGGRGRKAARDVAAAEAAAAAATVEFADSSGPPELCGDSAGNSNYSGGVNPDQLQRQGSDGSTCTSSSATESGRKQDQQVNPELGILESDDLVSPYRLVTTFNCTKLISLRSLMFQVYFMHSIARKNITGGRGLVPTGSSGNLSALNMGIGLNHHRGNGNGNGNGSASHSGASTPSMIRTFSFSGNGGSMSSNSSVFNSANKGTKAVTTPSYTGLSSSSSSLPSSASKGHFYNSFGSLDRLTFTSTDSETETMADATVAGSGVTTEAIETTMMTAKAGAGVGAGAGAGAAGAVAVTPLVSSTPEIIDLEDCTTASVLSTQADIGTGNGTGNGVGLGIGNSYNTVTGSVSTAVGGSGGLGGGLLGARWSSSSSTLASYSAAVTANTTGTIAYSAEQVTQVAESRELVLLQLYNSSFGKPTAAMRANLKGEFESIMAVSNYEQFLEKIKLKKSPLEMSKMLRAAVVRSVEMRYGDRNQTFTVDDLRNWNAVVTNNLNNKSANKPKLSASAAKIVEQSLAQCYLGGDPSWSEVFASYEQCSMSNHGNGLNDDNSGASGTGGIYATILTPLLADRMRQLLTTTNTAATTANAAATTQQNSQGYKSQNKNRDKGRVKDRSRGTVDMDGRGSRRVRSDSGGSSSSSSFSHSGAGGAGSQMSNSFKINKQQQQHQQLAVSVSESIPTSAAPVSAVVSAPVAPVPPIPVDQTKRVSQGMPWSLVVQQSPLQEVTAATAATVSLPVSVSFNSAVAAGGEVTTTTSNDTAMINSMPEGLLPGSLPSVNDHQLSPSMFTGAVATVVVPSLKTSKLPPALAPIPTPTPPLAPTQVQLPPTSVPAASSGLRHNSHSSSSHIPTAGPGGQSSRRNYRDRSGSESSCGSGGSGSRFGAGVRSHRRQQLSNVSPSTHPPPSPKRQPQSIAAVVVGTTATAEPFLPSSVPASANSSTSSSEGVALRTTSGATPSEATRGQQQQQQQQQSQSQLLTVPELIIPPPVSATCSGLTSEVNSGGGTPGLLAERPFSYSAALSRQPSGLELTAGIETRTETETGTGTRTRTGVNARTIRLRQQQQQQQQQQQFCFSDSECQHSSSAPPSPSLRAMAGSQSRSQSQNQSHSHSHSHSNSNSGGATSGNGDVGGIGIGSHKNGPLSKAPIAHKRNASTSSNSSSSSSDGDGSSKVYSQSK